MSIPFNPQAPELYHQDLLFAQLKNAKKYYDKFNIFISSKEEPCRKRMLLDNAITQSSFIIKDIYSNLKEMHKKEILAQLRYDVQQDMIALNTQFHTFQNEIESLDATGLMGITPEKLGIPALAKTINGIIAVVGLSRKSTSPAVISPSLPATTPPPAQIPGTPHPTPEATPEHSSVVVINLPPENISFSKTLKHLTEALKSIEGTVWGEFLKRSLSNGFEIESKNVVLLLTLINWLKSNDDTCSNVPEVFQASMPSVKIVADTLKKSPKNILDQVILNAEISPEYSDLIALMKNIVREATFTAYTEAQFTENTYAIVFSEPSKDNSEKNLFKLDSKTDVAGMSKNVAVNGTPRNSKPHSPPKTEADKKNNGVEKESGKSNGSPAVITLALTVQSLIAKGKIKEAELLVMRGPEELARAPILQQIVKAYVDKKNFIDAERVISLISMTPQRDASLILLVKAKLKQVHAETANYLSDINKQILSLKDPLAGHNLLNILLDNIRKYLTNGGADPLLENKTNVKSPLNGTLTNLMAENLGDLALAEAIKMPRGPKRDEILNQMINDLVKKQKFIEAEDKIKLFSDDKLHDSALAEIAKGKLSRILQYMKIELTQIDKLMNAISSTKERESTIEYYLKSSSPAFVKIITEWYTEVAHSFH